MCDSCEVPNFTEGLAKLAHLNADDVPIAVVDTPLGKSKFHMYGEYTEFRVRTLLTKEPETVAWISSLSAGDVFWDIGANIGLYTVLAGLRGMKVSAFEPSPTNFWLLNQNVSLNRLSNVQCLPLALSGTTSLVPFQVDLTPAAAGVNQIAVTSSMTVTQSYRADDLVLSRVVAAPQHLKIDVDGIELEILNGANSLLTGSSVKTVMCEVDESDKSTTTAIHSLLTSNGFSNVTTRFPPYFDDNYYLPRANHLFQRPGH